MASLSLPPGWVLQKSRSTGKRYYYNEGTRMSVWFEETLPHGWGWIMDGPNAPKFYVELATMKRQSQSPAAAQAPSEQHIGASENVAASEHGDDDGSAPPSKRQRVDNEQPNDPATSSFIAAAPPTAAVKPPSAAPIDPFTLNPGAIPGRPPARFPRLAESDFVIGKSAERPNLARNIQTEWFGEAHKRVLSQLLEGAMRSARQRDHQMATYNKEGAAQTSVVIYDVGCGTGAVTEYCVAQMEASPHPLPYEVYGVDLFDLGLNYYRETLAEFGQEALADVHTASAFPKLPVPLGTSSSSSSVSVDGAEGDASAASNSSASRPRASSTTPRLYDQFCVNFWECESVTPARYHDDFFMKTTKVS